MSVSNTSTITHKDAIRTFVNRERTYDYLYDPVYTVSSEVDHIKSSIKAYTSKDRVLKIPEYGSMFSNLPHYPRFKFCLDPTDPVPTTVDRRWRSHTKQYKEALHQLASVGRSASSWLQKEEGRVTGSDHWKYFARPLIPFEQQLPPDVIFALPKEEFVSSVDQIPKQKPTHVTVAVQTDYRESETQTDPYSPEYIIQSVTTPSELLTIASLTWGHGLPAGLAEVEMIERVRAKRAWEATLPPLDDLRQLDKRRRMMEEMEAKEWAFREGEIHKLKEARLAVLTDLWRKRDENQQNYTHDRLKQINHKLQKEKRSKINKINNDCFRAIRKLDSRHSTAMEKLTHFYHFKDYSDLYSHRHSAVRGKRDADMSKSYNFDTTGLTAMKPRTAFSHKPAENRYQSSRIKNSGQRAIQLYEQYKALLRSDRSENPLECLVNIDTPSPPVTPEVVEPPEGEEEREIAVINLQKLLRGRAIQYELIKGKENHLNLIRELRTVHALQSEEQELQKAQKDRMLNLKQERDVQSRRTEQLEALQARAVGTELEYMFDTLSKELIRLQQERRIHAFTLLAERDRRVREAEESGQRQVEERRRKEEDDIFRQVVQINQESVDLYLENTILETTEKEANEQARKEIHQLTKEFNEVACALEESLQSEVIVYDLVYSFLLPEVVKTSVRQKVQQRQERHLQAAQSIIQEAFERVSSPDHTTQSLSNPLTQNPFDERVKEPGPHTDANN
ncbi:cilia- and flagella-associated protein 91-like [Eucyclogobius newberryi]|uniref:cilia- and flagella-associated protein 91-like n=1 Tax=Eucyclogobius newberryi TaxID=166745 RepID=UPI003B5A9A8C